MNKKLWRHRRSGLSIAPDGTTWYNAIRKTWLAFDGVGFHQSVYVHWPVCQSTSFTSMGSQVRVLLRPPPKNPDIDTMSGFFLFCILLQCDRCKTNYIVQFRQKAQVKIQLIKIFMHHIVRSSKRHRVFSSVIFLFFPRFFVKSEPPSLLQRQPSRNS